MAGNNYEKFVYPCEQFSTPNHVQSMKECFPRSSRHEEYQLQSEVVNTSNVAGRKGKISRTQFSIYQKVALENSFLSSLYLTSEERDALAFKLGLSPAIVQTWFKNRRFKWRKEIKKAEGGRPERVMAASPVLLLPSPPALPYQRPNLAPADHQDGSMYAGCSAVNPPMRFSSNTHW